MCNWCCAQEIRWIDCSVNIARIAGLHKRAAVPELELDQYSGASQKLMLRRHPSQIFQGMAGEMVGVGTSGGMRTGFAGSQRVEYK